LENQLFGGVHPIDDQHGCENRRETIRNDTKWLIMFLPAGNKCRLLAVNPDEIPTRHDGKGGGDRQDRLLLIIL